MTSGEPQRWLDASFAIRGKTLPTDHGYALFAAISRLVPVIHERKRWGVHHVLGRRAGNGLLELGASSRVTVRLPADEVHHLLPLTGATLDVDGSKLRLGPPQLLPLVPAAYLYAGYVTVKGFEADPGSFDLALRRQIDAIPSLQEEHEHIEISVGRRRVARVANHTIVGFAVALAGLLAPASIAIQIVGLGGRRHMGAGIFRPKRMRW